MAGTQSQPSVNWCGHDGGRTISLPRRWSTRPHVGLPARATELRHARVDVVLLVEIGFVASDGDLGGLPHPGRLADRGRGPGAGADHALPLRSRGDPAGPAALRPHRARHGDPGRHHGGRRRVLRTRPGRDPGLHPDGRRAAPRAPCSRPWSVGRCPAGCGSWSRAARRPSPSPPRCGQAASASRSSAHSGCRSPTRTRTPRSSCSACPWSLVSRASPSRCRPITPSSSWCWPDRASTRR